jgi:single-strand DNA-binding protein
MLTITGNGRLTRDVELRSTRSGKSVATVSIASDRRDRKSDPVYVDLILWEGQADAAAQHLIKGQAITFSGRLEPRPYQTSSGEQRVAIEIHNVDLEYGARPRGQEDAEPAGAPAPASAPSDDDIPF